MSRSFRLLIILAVIAVPSSSLGAQLDGGSSELCVTTFRAGRGGDTISSNEIVPTLRLNAHYDYKGCFLSVAECASKRMLADDGRFVISVPVGELVIKYTYFVKADLVALCYDHRIVPPKPMRKESLLQKLQYHRCDARCASVVYEFKVRAKERANAAYRLTEQLVDIRVNVDGTAERRRPNNDNAGDNMVVCDDDAIADEDEEDGMDVHDMTHLEVADDELKNTIIEEWEAAMGTKAHLRYVCASCSMRVPDHEIIRVRSTRIPLHLLRNPELPREVWPTTCNFAEYDYAILNPKGLTNRQQRSDIDLCGVCWKTLKRGEMPKFALANWLYSGFDELSEPVRKAFEESTRVDRMLVSRARLSRICFKYSAKPEHPAAKDPISSQTYNRGNVMVMPQDSVHIQQVLPPSTDEVRDTVCAVFVGKEKPNRATIRRLNPMLVRKSRVLAMANHLTTHNPLYKEDDSFAGFDEPKLHALFTVDDLENDEGILAGIEVGHIPPGEGLESATADYTPRNDHTRESDSELVMENVGFTSGDNTPENVMEMKTSALKHCLDGNQFVVSRSGNDFVPDFDNPNLLSWAFPQLDPWGIVGFHHPKRKIPLSLDEQLRHLLRCDDTRFERDTDFAFVYYNIKQKMSVYRNVRYVVSENKHREVIDELLKIDADVLKELEHKFFKDPMYRPEDDREKSIIRVLAKVNLVGSKIPGSAAYKLCLRNEIRAMINYRGTPALFVTLNPADVDNPIVRVLGRENINIEDLMRGEDMDAHRRKIYAAKHPAACAMFFHSMISNFVKIVLRYGKGKGLFGKCTAYYATVETQGKGTLHCHMLIWLEGHPSPQILRDKMASSVEYTRAMFDWLESIIKNELPSDEQVVTEPGGKPLARPDRKTETGDPHPGVIAPPSVRDDDFKEHFPVFVESLVKEYNWHVHNATCWKYLKKGEEGDDTNCRMRMDGVTRESTSLDADTSSILLRRLHPRIASYNDLVVFLMRCNMDIKFIGSGEAAKALVYYVTDYITKASLPTHVGLAALLVAIRKANDRMANQGEKEDNGSYCGAMTMTVNSMMAKQEISHQHVMAYLVGGGDHYKSDTFSTLYMTAIGRFVGGDVVDDECEGAPDVGDDGQTHGVNEAGEVPIPSLNNGIQPVNEPAEQLSGQLDVHVVEDEGDETEGVEGNGVNKNPADAHVVLNMDRGNITASGQLYDYIYRSEDKSFDLMCLYEFVSKVQCAKQPTVNHLDYDNGWGYSGPGKFSSSDHPQFATHRLKMRETSRIPVILGPKIPRRGTNSVSEQKWARAMCILFKPWRRPGDLRSNDQSWLDAFLSYEDKIKQKYRKVIAHMDVLSECREAKTEYSAILERQRRSRNIDVLIEDALDNSEASGSGVGFGAVYDIFDESQGVLQASATTSNANVAFNDVLGRDCTRIIDTYLSGSVADVEVDESEIGNRLSVLAENVSGHEILMRNLKRKRRPDVPDVPEGSAPFKRRRIRAIEPIVFETNVDADEEMSGAGFIPEMTFDDIMYKIIRESGLETNPEQERAFRIVAEHIRAGDRADQLLMYTGGVGGTGKSHIVKCILKLFEALGMRHQVLVGAPTGIASILIEGHTMHALLNLPDKHKSRVKELREMWKPVFYLIIDEVSMISAKFLSEICNRLRLAKGNNNVASAKLYGGINIIFTGDFGQLKPVKASALYRYELVNNPSYAQCKDTDGVSALNGAYLWRQVNRVVILKQKKRQEGDARYGQLLDRVRVGKCHTTHAVNSNGRPGVDHSDLDILRSRQMDLMMLKSPGELSQFRDAPIIVGTRRLRDAINAKLIQYHSGRVKKDVKLYYAQDFVMSKPAEGSLKQKLLELSSSTTEDAMGKLPLFEGMKVMVTSNLAISSKVVNGSEGVVRDIVYSTNSEGVRFATAVYVHIPGVGKITEDLPEGVVPIFAERNTFRIRVNDGRSVKYRYVSRLQVPIVPAYAYTDYKSQGRSLKYAIVDLYSARSLQGAYVMLSRVHSLQGLAILRWFPATKIHQRPPQDLRSELERLSRLDDATKNLFGI